MAAMPRWWLSFADADRPKGKQLLGVCIVEGVDMIAAIKAAHARGINPGGEVAGLKIDEAAAARLSFSITDFENRLLPPEEARTLDARIASELDS